MTSAGNFGIGTADPRAKLHVNGVSYTSINSAVRAYFAHNDYSTSQNNKPTLTRNSNGWGNASIYATGDIISKTYFVSHSGTVGASDERIKKDIVDVEDGSALETLRLLKPKKYKYKDVVKCGTEPVWGFIAQEVRETLPYATELRTEYLPNIYELAIVSDSNVITFTNFDTSTLESNVMALQVIDGEDMEHFVNIKEVIDEHSIRVDEDLSEWTGSVEGSDIEKIFVYGQQVEDFIFVKKEAIWTVATAALQEVDRQQQADKVEIAALKTQLTSVLARLDALENPN